MTIPNKSKHAIVADVLALQRTQVFVVGDLILDSYRTGPVERISPEAPVPVVHLQHAKDVLGGGGNVAANICALGGEVFLCGRLGTDDAGKIFTGIAEDLGINTTAIVYQGFYPTTRKTRILSGSQQLLRIDEETKVSLHPDQEKQILLSFERFAVSATGSFQRALVLSDYGKGVLTESLLPALIATASQYGIPVVTDPKKANVSLYRGTTVLKPNKLEAAEILKRDFSNKPLLDAQVGRVGADQLSEVLGRILEISGAENVVLSLSADGVACAGKLTDQVTFRYPSTVLRISDVSGAGDTMVAVLAMGLAAKLSLPRATQLGNIAAGLVCAKPGTATISAAELIQGYHLADGEHLYEKIIDKEAVVPLSERLRFDNQKVIFTNGCFDLLHPGHIQTLVAARQKGNFLIVGLNSDASVKRLKGESRPIQTEESRAIVLASLSFVDFVVIFDEDTPLELIRRLRPDVLVKGGDYTLDQIVGAEDVLSWGGKVETVPLVPKQSTTLMIQRSERSVRN